MLKLGIIGVGGYGWNNVLGFLNLQAEGRVKIAALADISTSALEDCRARPELSEARCFTDYRDLLDAPGLEAVLINVPIPFHREATLAALGRGLAILLEKPAVPLLSQLDELIEADREGRVMVGFQHVYSSLVTAARESIRRGGLGRLKSVSAWGIWPRPTSYYHRAGWAGQIEWRGLPVLDGPCTNAFAHYINLALHLCGSDGRSQGSPVGGRGEAYRARPDIPSYDTGFLRARLEGDIACSFAFTHAAARERGVTIRLAGSRGELLFSGNGRELRLPDGAVLCGDDGQMGLRRAFVAFARGDRERNLTPLEASRPFLSATHLMLAASGGIHQIPAEHSCNVARESGEDEEGDLACAIPGIERDMARCVEDFLTPGEAGLAWAADAGETMVSEGLEAEMLHGLGTGAGLSVPA
ncbi:predicted dehydrogenase [Terrimicrobium sacchariphilum]|uniref:Predicted dehydrogenase n=1 Tax=Terrimicrobium sacchariphilum TaxID=690879 RepID=A0A146GBW9_TERSA|nr:Gfo/Idh/MocA family oxidoreductase [Terrimicrobium sacchariphilum]GAT34036.1 predicted dehydrogenase [Terrimicrobium sacchariphilum]